jgi:hypothetical protein
MLATPKNVSRARRRPAQGTSTVGFGTMDLAAVMVPIVLGWLESSKNAVRELSVLRNFSCRYRLIRSLRSASVSFQNALGGP